MPCWRATSNNKFVVSRASYLADNNRPDRRPSLDLIHHSGERFRDDGTVYVNENVASSMQVKGACPENRHLAVLFELS